MIVRLAGILLDKTPPYILVDVRGVGYEVQAPMSSIYPLPERGEPVVLLTHLSVSENAHQLFGFYTLEERELFRLLIKVNGVGPKMALAILSGMSAAEFAHCVRTGDTPALVKVPGVGKKTAERLIIEVKDRLPAVSARNSGVEASVEAINTLAQLSSTEALMMNDGESALVALGYKPAEAARLVSATLKHHSPNTVEELIRLTLKQISA